MARAYLALGGGHLCKQSLGHFGPLHLLLDLVVDVGVDVEDGALGLAVPLAGQRRRLHLAGKGAFSTTGKKKVHVKNDWVVLPVLH